MGLAGLAIGSALQSCGSRAEWSIFEEGRGAAGNASNPAIVGRPSCANGGCPKGWVCSAGQCQALLDIGGTKGAYGDAGSGCVNLDVGFEGETPTVVVLVDQSASMDEYFPLGQRRTTRWTVLRDALLDEAAGAVARVAMSVRLGLALYSSHGGSANGAVCPELIRVPIAMNNYDAIARAYRQASAAADTPTPESITAVAEQLASERGPRYILLVTDGLPDTCADADANGDGVDPARQAAANRASIAAARAAYASGVGLIIVGVSPDIAESHLQDMANAGAGKDETLRGPGAARYFVAQDSQAKLAEQLTGILGSVRTCLFHLAGEVTRGHEADWTVTLDGVRLAPGDPDGYRLVSPRDLEIVGAACEKIKSDGRALSVSFPCDAFFVAR